MLKTKMIGSETIVIAAEYIKAGTKISRLSGEVRDESTKYTIQTGLKEHTDAPFPFRYMSHRCNDPNTAFIFDEEPWACVALEDIPPGAEISCDYDTTEYICFKPIDCWCKSEKCRKTVKGYYYLSDDEKEMLKDKVSPAIKMLSVK